METVSKEKLPKFQRLGMTLVVNFNEQEITVTDGDGVSSMEYHYNTAKVCATSHRDERIEELIKTKYPTYGAELAAMHKGGVIADQYLAFVDYCKLIATESFKL